MNILELKARTAKEAQFLYLLCIQVFPENCIRVSYNLEWDHFIITVASLDQPDLSTSEKIETNILEEQPGNAYLIETGRGNFLAGVGNLLVNTAPKLKTRVIYGDSVSGDTPLLLKNPETGIITIKTFEDVVSEENWIPYEEFKSQDSNRKEKQQAPTNYLVWTDHGWKKIVRLIRHKTVKQMLRVHTNTGCIDVTEDHSLISETLEKVSPKNCKTGDKLLHSFPQEFPEKDIIINFNFDKCRKKNQPVSNVIIKCKKCDTEKTADNFPPETEICKDCISESYYAKSDKTITKKKYAPYFLTKEEAWIWGFFFANGSSGRYNTKWGVKYSWAINNQNLEYLNKAKQVLETIDPQNEFKIIQTMESSNVYKLIVKGDINHYALKYRHLFYDHKRYKKVPDEILNAKREIRQEFFKGYYVGDGCKTEVSKRGLQFVNKGKIGTQGLYYLTKSLGHNFRIRLYKSKPNCFSLYEGKTNFHYTDTNEIKNIVNLGTTASENDFVYDIETEIGRFHGGIGEIVASNTDSVFCAFDSGKPKDEQMEESWRLAQLCGHQITDTLFEKPIDLEFEKVYKPFLQFGKKIYTGKKYEFDGSNPNQVPSKFKIDSAGIVMKRRDNPPIVRKIYGEAQRIIMDKEEDGIEEAKKSFQRNLRKLINGEVDTEDFVISKSLKNNYKKTSKCDEHKKLKLKSDDPEVLDCPDCTTSVPHAVLAKIIGERNPGSAPVSGDRIPYVFKQTAEQTNKQFMKVEDPEFMQQSNTNLDVLYYFQHAIENPIKQFFGVMMDEPEKLWMDEIEELLPEKKTRKRKNNSEENPEQATEPKKPRIKKPAEPKKEAAEKPPRKTPKPRKPKKIITDKEQLLAQATIKDYFENRNKKTY